jgi:Kef-type K+ transport system membrane component KefB
MHSAIDATEAFLLALGIIFVVPYVIWRSLRSGHWLPLVVVQILTGLLFGPGLFGRWFPHAYQCVFQPAVTIALNGIGAWAVMLFIALAGVELDLRSAWAERRTAGLTAVLALGVPLLCGCAVALALLGHPGWLGGAARHWQFVLAVGMACAVTALPVLILFLEQLALLHRPLGQRILRYASLDDVAIWGVLAVILMDWERLARQVGFLIAFAGAATLLRRLLPRLAAGDRWSVALIWLVLCASGAEWAGLHFLVGAFLSGAVLEAVWFERETLTYFRRFVLLALMPVYFLSTGLRTNWSLGGPAVLLVTALLALAAIGGKLIGTRIAAYLLGWARDEAWVVGGLLQTKGLVLILFSGVLLDKELISGGTFTALLLMGLVSTVVTVPLVATRLPRACAALGGVT